MLHLGSKEGFIELVSCYLRSGVCVDGRMGPIKMDPDVRRPYNFPCCLEKALYPCLTRWAGDTEQALAVFRCRISLPLFPGTGYS